MTDPSSEPEYIEAVVKTISEMGYPAEEWEQEIRTWLAKRDETARMLSERALKAVRQEREKSRKGS